jgi:hypothetical protein
MMPCFLFEHLVLSLLSVSTLPLLLLLLLLLSYLINNTG